MIFFVQLEGSAAGKLVHGWLVVCFSASGTGLEGWRLVVLVCWCSWAATRRLLRHGCFGRMKNVAAYL